MPPLFQLHDTRSLQPPSPTSEKFCPLASHPLSPQSECLRSRRGGVPVSQQHLLTKMFWSICSFMFSLFVRGDCHFWGKLQKTHRCKKGYLLNQWSFCTKGCCSPKTNMSFEKNCGWKSNLPFAMAPYYETFVSFLGWGYTMVYTSWSRKPSLLNRRSTLPALLDVNSESLMLSRQLHLDFHEVKCVVPWYMEQCLASSGGVKRKSDCDHFSATEVDIVVDGLPVVEEVTISCTPREMILFSDCLATLCNYLMSCWFQGAQGAPRSGLPDSASTSRYRFIIRRNMTYCLGFLWLLQIYPTPLNLQMFMHLEVGTGGRTSSPQVNMILHMLQFMPSFWWWRQNDFLHTYIHPHIAR